MNLLARLARFTAAVSLVVALPVSADANVRREGQWPAADKKVSFVFEGTPSEGLKKLAAESGWSLVVSKGIAVGEQDVKIDVAGQPADAVLEALFAESDVVARRSGTLITVTRAAGDASAAGAPQAAPQAAPVAAPPAAPLAAPPVPTVRGEDRNVLGSSVVVGKDEVVHTVTVTGGSATIHGTVTGDLIVAGGSAKIMDGGRVVGNATAFGGSLKVESGGRVDGDVGIVGGYLKREEGSIIGGKVVSEANGHPGRVKVTLHDGETSTTVDTERAGKPGSGRGRLAEAAHSFGQSVTNMSLLFVLGCVLLALATRKMETLRVETAARPMKSFAVGIVGILVALLTVIALCVTLVGIPMAILALLIAVFAVYASIAAVLTTFGAAVAGHKTQNPYVHLLVGCVGLLLASLIPYVGGLVTFGVTMIAIGALVTTRLAGIVDRRGAKAALV